MNKFLYILMLCCLNTVYGYNQTIIVSGNIKDSKGVNLQSISVTLEDMDSVLVAYTYSDDLGNYKLSCVNKSEHLMLSISGLNIVKQSVKITNKTQVINFTTKEEAKQLKEVVVTSKKIYYNKDTINYSVSAFCNIKDQTIGDVLKKMPGIQVSESGQVSYQGKAINKFYIENMDLLNDRYGIATHNVPAKDVATVQVLENHQPIKLLDGIKISDQAAINLKLKEKSKGVLNLMLGLGVGAKPFLWDNDLTAMYFGRKMQNISTFKSNNDGNDLSKELRSFSNTMDLNVEKLMYAEAPTPPDIDKKRYYFNNSNAATVNNLFNLGKNREINFNLIYYNDYEKRNSNVDTKYYLSNDNLLRIKEGLNSYSNVNRLETEFRYNENSDKRYLNNLLTIEGSWENESGNIQIESLIKQHLYMPSFKVINSFSIMKVKGDKGYIFSSNIGFRTSPQNMNIVPGLYPNFMNFGNSYNMLNQQGKTNTFRSNNKLTFISLLRIGGIKINPNAGINIHVNHLNSELFASNQERMPLVNTPDSLKNNLNLQHYTAYVGTEINYSIERFKLNLELPFSYNYYLLRNQSQTEYDKNLNRFNLNPLLTIQYKMTSNITLGASSDFYNSISSIYEMYSGYILSSYNVLNRYENRFNENNGNISSLNFVYKNIFKMFFFDIGFAYTNQKNSATISQNFNGNLQTLSYIDKSNISTNKTISADVSKGFDWKKLVIKISPSYSIYDAQQFSQNNLIDYRNTHISLKGSISMLPFSFLSLDYEGVWGQSQLLLANNKYTPIQSFKETLMMNVTLFEKLDLSSQLEHYYNNAVETKRNLLFADVNMSYKWKQLNFSLGWTNIFNTQDYVKSYYNGISQYNYVYDIRPTNIIFKVKFKLK